jgi:hypothetical protein
VQRSGPQSHYRMRQHSSSSNDRKQGEPMKRIARLLTIAVVLTMVALSAGATMTVYCYSCGGPAQSDGCSFNGRSGTWGADVVLNGVVYHTCVIPGLVKQINPKDAFTNRAQLLSHAAAISRQAPPPPAQSLPRQPQPQSQQK